MLFRTEEVILTSSASLVDDTFFREHIQKLTLIGFDMDTFNAMSAGIIEFDAVSPVLAADQQQEIDCSRYAKLLIIVHSHGMKREAQPFMKSISIFCQAVAANWRAFLKRQEPKSRQHFDAVVYFIDRDGQSDGGGFRPR